jgi:hypothetical protein
VGIRGVWGLAAEIGAVEQPVPVPVVGVVVDEDGGRVVGVLVVLVPLGVEWF